ncbi:MAG: cell division protein FtsQ [Bacteroidaceae bacterium]|nr:cell division protein FtsQ [Bacteroidaceae bacterium]
MKRILLLIAMLAVSAYLAVAFTWLNHTPPGQMVEQVKIVVEDSARTCFITPTEASALLKRNRLYPTGKNIDSVQCKSIEDFLEKNSFIDNAECYKTPAGNICIYIEQRLPILRVISDKGLNCYIDDKGRSMPGSGHAAHLPVATGNIDKNMAEGPLFELAQLLGKDEFWKRQVEQIHVTPEGEIELVPHVGDHILFLGKPDRIEEKLERIRTFYAKGLSRVGWNKYSRISVEFDNQVICKRK